MAHSRSNDFPVPFRNAPYHTHHIVSVDDFKTTNLNSYVRHNAHSITRAVYDASKERRANQAITCKLDPPFRLWLTEKETRRKDYIKFKFEKRGLYGHRPTSHLVTKKELQSHHLRNEVDDYHLSQNVELCDKTIHPEHKLGVHAHANQYHEASALKLQTLNVSKSAQSLSKSPSPTSKSPTTKGLHSSSASKLPPVK